MASWFVYILRCADGTLYTGITNDLAARLGKHNDGTASKYTRSRTPVVVARTERVATRGAALRREARIKRMTRREKLLLIGTGG